MPILPAHASFEDFVHARGSSLFRTALLLTGQNRAEAEGLLQLVVYIKSLAITNAPGAPSPATRKTQPIGGKQ